MISGTQKGNGMSILATILIVIAVIVVGSVAIAVLGALLAIISGGWSH